MDGDEALESSLTEGIGDFANVITKVNGHVALPNQSVVVMRWLVVR